MSYMRPAQQQANGYPNGGQQIRRYDLDASSRDTSADERSRSRPGHGGGGYGRQQAPAQQVQGVSRLDRGNANRRSRDYEWSQSRSRSRAGAGGGAGRYGHEVEDVLRYIEKHWSFMASSSCVPVKVALQLEDASSLGLAGEMDQFTRAHAQLQNALKVIVNEHHQGFNSSIGTFHKIQQAIHASQHRVRTLRAGLVQAKANLATNRPELKALAGTSQSYDQMLQVVGTIEQLQVVPDQLEAQIREKRFLGAVENLLEALKLVRKPELEDIGALSELRVRLSNQEQILTDMLVEELHNHLYLKSPYCEERWKAHAKRKYESSNAAPSTSSNDNVNATSWDSEERSMYRFLSTYDGSTAMQEEPTRNAEADTFYFIQLLIESLNKMSKLDFAVDKIEERLPLEFHKLLERTLSEVEQRHPTSVLRTHNAERSRQMAVFAGPDAERRAVLEDLLNTLYAKFEAIAESHRVLHDVTAAILKRDAVPADEADTLNRSFRELWKLLQAEMRSLMHDHLATNGNLGGGRSRQEKDASANIFKTLPRDKNRRLFKLTDTMSADLATETEDLEGILKASVPGLVNASKDDAKKDLSHMNAGYEGRELEDRSATGHKLLVEPSVFNMAILLPPSLTFLNNLKDIVPHANIALTAFLDDFLINVFYPQLEETLIELCSRSLSDLDTFQPDPAWPNHAARPIFKGTARFFELVERFCGLLDGLPHEQAFAQLVVTQMRVYYDRCYEWSKSLLQRVQMSEQQEGNASAGVQMRMAAELATSGEISDVVIELLKTTEKKDLDELAQKESDLLLRLAKRRELEDADLIHDRKALAALCTLQVSMKWLASKCKQLRFLSPWAVDTANTQASSKVRRRWTTHMEAASTAHTAHSAGGPYLPLDEQTAQQFDAVVLSFSELSTLVLRTLHIDLRLHVLQGVYKALDTTYALNQPYNDPDPAIAALSKSLSTYGAELTSHLLPAQTAFLVANLSVLANTALPGLVSSIPAMDAHGVARMTLNILVLQQSFKSLQPDADLAKAARFYELGSQGPQAVVEQGPNEVYAFAREDLKALCRLCWEEERDAPMLGDREAFVMKLGGWPTRKQSLKGRVGRGGRSPRAGAGGGGSPAGTPTL